MGSPVRKQEEIDVIFNICTQCKFYKKNTETEGKCGVCGCFLKKTGYLLNKIAWATTRCPLEEPKWVEQQKQYGRPVDISREDLLIAENEHDKQLKASGEKPADCGCS